MLYLCSRRLVYFCHPKTGRRSFLTDHNLTYAFSLHLTNGCACWSLLSAEHLRFYLFIFRVELCV